MKRSPHYRSVKKCGRSPVSSCTSVNSKKRFPVRKTIRTSGYVMQFHKNDKDFMKGSHGHILDDKLYIDYRTGQFYDALTKNPTKKLSKKELEELQNLLRKAGFSI